MRVDAKRRILAFLARRRSATGAELRTHLEVSRQALSVHMRSLVEAGKVVRSGAARAARYMLRGRAPAAAVVARALRTRGLDESRIWDELATGLTRNLLLDGRYPFKICQIEIAHIHC